MHMIRLSHSDSHPVGTSVAEAVANRLETGTTLAYGHRDYCGTGLRFVDGEYIYGEVSDGMLPSTKELQEWAQVPTAMERIVFSNRTEFVAWLAAQTDASLNGSGLRDPCLVGNQRLSKRRLLAFAHGAPVPHTA